MIKFKHSGKIGDVIYALPTIKALCEGEAKLLLAVKQKTFSKKTIEQIRPLLLSQDYIAEVGFWNKEKVRYDLDRFRMFFKGKYTTDNADLLLKLQVEKRKATNSVNIAKAHLYVFGLPLELCEEKWLTVEPNKKLERKILISRSAYGAYPRNTKFSWQAVYNKYKNTACYIGLYKEYKQFVQDCGNAIPYYETKDLLDVAMTIEASELLITAQSGIQAIAEGLKKDYILEVPTKSANAFFRREGVLNARKYQ